jgi:hypothetical protein
VALALALGVLAQAAPASAASGTFTDDDGSIHEGYIEAIVAEQITQGCQPTLYCPKAPVERGQMATFLVRALGIGSSSEDFFDDDETSVHEGAINSVAAAGIVQGDGSRRFRPRDPVTRGQMATFLAVGFDLPATDQDFFADDDGTTHEANINRVAAAGIASGDAQGRYQPGVAVSREQMATFLGRALGLEPIPPAAG